MTSDTELARSAGRLVRRTALVVLIGVVGTSIAVALAGGATDAIAALRAIDPSWLAAGVAAEILSYLLLAQLLHRLTGQPPRVSYWVALRLSFVVFGLGILAPAAPAEGALLGAAELRREGLNTRRSLLALGLAEWIGTAGGWALAALNALLVVALGHIAGEDGVILVIVATSALLAIGFISFMASRPSTAEVVSLIADRAMFWRENRSERQLRHAGARLHAEGSEIVGGIHQRVVVVACAALAWLADASCFAAALRAAGVDISLDIVLLAYTAGILATLIPFLPGGLGIVEAAVPAVLHAFGVPFREGLAAAVAYRAMGTFAPAAIGALLLPSLRILRGVEPDNCALNERSAR